MPLPVPSAHISSSTEPCTFRVELPTGRHENVAAQLAPNSFAVCPACTRLCPENVVGPGHDQDPVGRTEAPGVGSVLPSGPWRASPRQHVVGW